MLMGGGDTADAMRLLDDSDERGSQAGDSPEPDIESTPSKHHRLASLDIVRGITIAVMILVDDVGGVYPHVNHSPWNDITLADFVMPWFLFMVGASMAFSLRKFKENRKGGSWHVFVRAMKLFCLGVFLQGGGAPDVMNFSFGFNLATTRWCGILQRIAYAYLVCGMMELWIPVMGSRWTSNVQGVNSPSGSQKGLGSCKKHMQVFAVHAWKWLASFLVLVLYLFLLLGVKVPDWSSEYGINPNLDKPYDTMITRLPKANWKNIECDVRGSLSTPECAANGYFDRLLFGQKWLGPWMSARSEYCSPCSPASYETCGGPKKDAPEWCFSHVYDPEGALATVPAVMSTWLGLHFGHVIKTPWLILHRQRLAHWYSLSAFLMALGFIIHQAGLKMNKQLWTPSYLFFMAGSCGACLASVYFLVDVTHKGPDQDVTSFRRHFRLLLRPFQFMGMNAILIFFFHGLAGTILNSVYVCPRDPAPNTVDYFSDDCHISERNTVLTWIQSSIMGVDRSDMQQTAANQLLYVLFEIFNFGLAAYILARRGYFWKV